MMKLMNKLHLYLVIKAVTKAVRYLTEKERKIDGYPHTTTAATYIK